MLNYSDNKEENRGCPCHPNFMNQPIRPINNCGCTDNMPDITIINFDNNECNTPNYPNNCCDTNCCPKDDATREEMMMKIRELNFAVIELGLYLDTHPDCQKALCLHREYTKQLKDIKDKYQKVYGPLSIYFPCNKWRWLEEPWVSFCLGVF